MPDSITRYFFIHGFDPGSRHLREPLRSDLFIVYVGTVTELRPVESFTDLVF